MIKNYFYLLLALLISCGESENCESKYYVERESSDARLEKHESTDIILSFEQLSKDCGSSEIRLNLDYQSIVNDSILEKVDSLSIRMESFPNRDSKPLNGAIVQNGLSLKMTACVDKIPNQNYHIISYSFFDFNSDQEVVAYDEIQLINNEATIITKTLNKYDVIKQESCSKTRDVYFTNGIDAICNDSFFINVCIIGGLGDCTITGVSIFDADAIDNNIEFNMDNYNAIFDLENYHAPCSGLSVTLVTE